MGCLVNRGGNQEEEAAPTITASAIAPEERIMMNNEKTLPFAKLSSKEIIRSLKAETMKEALSLPQLKRAFHELNIDSNYITDPDNPFHSLLRPLKNQKKLFDLKLFSVFAILTGKGSTQEKAAWLFKQYDGDASGILEKEELVNMLNDLIYLSCEVLPNWSKGTGTGRLTAEQLDSFLTPVKDQQSLIVEQIASVLLVEEQISEYEFAARIAGSQLECRQLLWSHGVRTLTRSLI